MDRTQRRLPAHRRGCAWTGLCALLALPLAASAGPVAAGGLQGLAPTATEDDLGLDQWLLGPELFLGYAGSRGFVGARVGSLPW